MPQSKDFPDAFYRLTVKGLCVEGGKLLLVRDEVVERPEGAIWELPGGGVDFGEDIRESLVREVKEEMGLTVTSVGQSPLYAWTIRREKGRGMEWYYIADLCYTMTLQDLNFTPSPECKEIKFFSLDEMKALPNLSPQLPPLLNLFNLADFA